MTGDAEPSAVHTDLSPAVEQVSRCVSRRHVVSAGYHLAFTEND